ncbi:MAG: DUF2269 family protein [Leptospirales bacterium]
MKKLLKFLHYIGLSIFLGSVLMFIIIGETTGHDNLESLVLSRQIIIYAEYILTLPGIFILLVSGFVMTFNSYKFFKMRWLNIKHIAIILIVLNAVFFLNPYAHEMLELAKQSLVKGELLAEYSLMETKEITAGAVNILLILLSSVAGIWRFKSKFTNLGGLNETL